MKVLWISQNVPFPPKTGVLLRNYNLIRLASRFATVDLVAIAKKTVLPSSYAEAAIPELQRLCSTVQVVRLPTEVSRLRFQAVVLKSLFTKTPFTVNWASAPVLRDVIGRALTDSSYDLVYFDSISLAAYRHVAAGTGRVLNHHNIESQLFERRIAYERNPLKRFYLRLEASKLRRYEAATVGDFDMNLVVSGLDASRLGDIHPGVRAAVIANGVDVDYFRESRDANAEPGHLIMVSGMNWFPNLDAVLFMTRTIWPALTKSMPGLKLTIVGASPPQTVKSLEARDSRIAVTGFVDDIRPYMDCAQVYLCPMRDGGGTRLKVLDALSMGKPIVATTIALEGIDVTPEKDVLVADTPDEFVRQIRRVVQDDVLRLSLSRNARVFVEQKFSWEVIGREMERVFSAVASGRHGHA